MIQSSISFSSVQRSQKWLFKLLLIHRGLYGPPRTIISPPPYTTGPLSHVLVTIIIIKYQIFPILKETTCPAVCFFYRNGYTFILFLSHYSINVIPSVQSCYRLKMWLNAFTDLLRCGKYRKLSELVCSKAKRIFSAEPLQQLACFDCIPWAGRYIQPDMIADVAWQGFAVYIIAERTCAWWLTALSVCFGSALIKAVVM